MAKVVVNTVDYSGGGTPFNQDVSYEYNRTQVVFQGFNTDDATIEVMPIGGANYKEITSDTTEYHVIINGSIVEIQVTVAGAVTGKITIVQWNE